jgi:hypothetical protein
VGKEEQWLLFPGAIGFVFFPAVVLGYWVRRGLSDELMRLPLLLPSWLLKHSFQSSRIRWQRL